MKIKKEEEENKVKGVLYIVEFFVGMKVMGGFFF